MQKTASALVAGLLALSWAGAASAQDVPGGCKDVRERKTEVGCWIIANVPVGQFTQSKVFWHLDAYQTRDAAEAAKSSPRSVVVEALGKVWLLTIEDAGWRASGGERVAEIGPLPISPGNYSVQYMEAVFTPGMTARAHTHAGPEAWYTVAGETCLETPDGKQVGRVGGPPVIVPGGPPMHLTATGTEVRKSLVLILHDSSKPATTLVHDWVPKGLCKD